MAVPSAPKNISVQEPSQANPTIHTYEQQFHKELESELYYLGLNR